MRSDSNGETAGDFEDDDGGGAGHGFAGSENGDSWPLGRSPQQPFSPAGVSCELVDGDGPGGWQ